MRMLKSAGLLFGLAALCGLAVPNAIAEDGHGAYQQTNLVSDLPGAVQPPDGNLVNPWGLARTQTTPWWVANNGTGTSTLYDGAGAKRALTVNIPGPDGTSPSAPTGAVAATTPTGGLEFVFDTEDGTIAAWTGGTSTVQKVNKAGAAVYKGLTTAVHDGATLFYAANFFSGQVEVYDAAFGPVNLEPGAFMDQNLPAGFAPFNVQSVDNMIVVCFAKQDDMKKDEVDGPGLGYVDVFDSGGTLKMRLEHGPWLNGPWGVALAPGNFGPLSRKLLIGNFGSGMIAAYNPKSGRFLRLMRGTNERPVRIPGLWSLHFGNGAAAGPVNTLFFTAGIDDEQHGLFGTLTFAREREKEHEDRDDNDE